MLFYRCTNRRSLRGLVSLLIPLLACSIWGSCEETELTRKVRGKVSGLETGGTATAELYSWQKGRAMCQQGPGSHVRTGAVQAAAFASLDGNHRAVEGFSHSESFQLLNLSS